MIERALSSDAARRIGPDYWVGAEAQLADWARVYRPDELAVLARQLIETLDQDGPTPDDTSQLNELHMTWLPDGGGRIKGQLDAPTFEVLTRAIRASLTPETDEQKTLGERQADALAAICEHALDTGQLPSEGGQRPHITAVLDYYRLAQHARGAALEFGGYTPAAQLRRILCNSCVTPVVLGGDSVVLDLGRPRRTAAPAQRAALAARDGGCATPAATRHHPG